MWFSQLPKRGVVCCHKLNNAQVLMSLLKGNFKYSIVLHIGESGDMYNNENSAG